MEYMNETYEDVASRQRPVSYLNPCAIKSDCVDDENYEALADIHTQFNIYESLPRASGDVQRPTRTKTSDVEQNNEPSLTDVDEIKKIKQDLRKMKVSVIIMAVFVAVFLLISLTAVALAVTTPLQNISPNQPEVIGSQSAVVGQEEKKLDASTQQMIANVSFELQLLRVAVDAIASRLNSEHSELVNQTQRNLSEVLSALDDTKRRLTFNTDELHHIMQHVTNESNTTSLAYQVTSLTNQSQLMWTEIMHTDNNIASLTIMQNYLERSFNATQSIVTQLRCEIGSVQNQLRETRGELESVNERATALEGQLITTQINVTTLNSQVNNLRQQLNTTQTSITSVASQAANIQESLNDYLSSAKMLYQDCHQNNTSCLVDMRTNNNRRLFCSTPTMNANITGFYTLDMRCEYSGTGQLIAPSLQKMSQTSYFCECSVVTPASNGSFQRLSRPSSPGNCTLVMTRCPLSQIIT